MEENGRLSNWTEFISMLPNAICIALFGYVIYRMVLCVICFQKVHTLFNRVQGPTNFDWFYGNSQIFNAFKDCADDVKVNFLMCLIKKYPGYFRLWKGPFNPVIVIYDPEIAKTFLQTSEDKDHSFSGLYRFLKPWLGDSLLVSGGGQWKKTRHMLTPAFHSEVLKSYMNGFNGAADSLINELSPIADTGIPVDVCTAVQTCALEIIMRCAFSYQTDFRKKRDIQTFINMVHAVKDTVDYRNRNPILYPDFIFNLTKKGREFSRHCKFLHEFACDVLSTRKKTVEKDNGPNKKYLDLVDVLLTSKSKENGGFSLVEMRDNVNNFLSAGFDSTSSAIQWTLYSIAEYQVVQDKVRAEVDGILEGRETNDLQWGDLARLEYLEMVIKESMRQHCPVPAIVRQSRKDFQIDSHLIPSGTPVAIDIYLLHHSQALWERPMEFIPERFSRENASKIKPFQFIPFSAGPRICPGQEFAMNEVKVVVARLVRRFKLTLEPSHVPKKYASIVMKSSNGIMLRLSSR